MVSSLGKVCIGLGVLVALVAVLLGVVLHVLIPVPEWTDGVPDFGVGEVDPACKDRDMWYYRTYDGSCNWLKKGEYKLGTAGGPFMRDRPAHYKPGTFGEPREGPNVRELSNAFFKNKLTYYWDHTPFLVAYVEFLVHEWMYSVNSHDPEDVMLIPVPKCDEYFDPQCHGNKTMRFTRSMRYPGTGVDSPRESVNGQTIWMDMSALYGVDKETTNKLRTFEDGKLKVNEDGKSLPWNTIGLSMHGMKGDSSNLFAAGDPRANQDYLLMAITNLFLLEHNRLCDVLKERYPEKEWDDEKLFLTARVVLSAKFSALGASYLHSYFTENRDRNPGLFMWESWFGEHWINFLQFVKYPFQRFLNPATNAPYLMPVEFSIGYRWHDILPSHMAIADERNNIVEWIDLTETAFDAKSFAKYGLESVVLGMSLTQIPDFRSGTQDNVRNVKWNMGQPEIEAYFDLAAWSIAHERERGVPPYNSYMKGYTGKVPSPPKNTFEEFSSDPNVVKDLKRLYNHPDEVDLSVGLELDELKWPSTHVPRSMLLTSFYTLSLLASQDRFALQYAMTHCFIKGRPWDCKPTNVLEELMWEERTLPEPFGSWFPNFKYRWWSQFWWDEFDIDNTGDTLFHTLVIQNTDVRCLQRNPFYAPSQERNPIICHDKPEKKTN